MLYLENLQHGRRGDRRPCFERRASNRTRQGRSILSENRSDFRGYTLEPSTNVEGQASIGRLLGIDDIANIDTLIVEAVGKRLVGVDRGLDAADSLA